MWKIKKGFIRLGDFYLAEHMQQQSEDNLNLPQTININNSFTALDKLKYGYLEYLAPEIIEKGNISASSDWWSLGVLSYELIVGINPFIGSNQDETKQNILKANTATKVARLRPGQAISRDGYNFIKKLLNKIPAQRLGSSGIEELKNHPFLHEIDVDAIERAMLFGKIKKPNMLPKDYN